MRAEAPLAIPSIADITATRECSVSLPLRPRAKKSTNIEIPRAIQIDPMDLPSVVCGWLPVFETAITILTMTAINIVAGQAQGLCPHSDHAMAI